MAFRAMYMISKDEYSRLKKIEEKYNNLQAKKEPMNFDGKGEPETSFPSSKLRFQQVMLEENKSKKQKPISKISINDLGKTSKPDLVVTPKGGHHSAEDEEWYYLGPL